MFTKIEAQAIANALRKCPFCAAMPSVSIELRLHCGGRLPPDGRIASPT